MIYTSKGYETNKLIKVESNEDDFETIVKSKVTTFTDVSSLESIKRHQAYYFIAGELSEPVRKNDNVLSKSLITLDYDGLDMTEEEFKNHLMSKISVLKFYAYPSIRHNIEGLRYRVVIDVDRPYTKEESTPVIQFVTSHIGLTYDESSETWSQLQGLKTSFESVEAFEGKCILNEGRGVLKIDNAIQKMREREASSRKKVEKEKPAFTVNYTRNRTFTAKFLESLIEPVEKGSRNVHLTKLVGKMFSLGMTAEAVYIYAHWVNENSLDPKLEEIEVDKIFRSILKKDTEKMEKEGAN